MSLHDDLLNTARYLLRRNQNRPTQADIRRSVSTAYYAVFHRLVGDAAARLAGETASQDVLARAFNHSDMKKGCQLVLKRPVPPPAVPFLGSAPSTELKVVASAFVELQDWRHKADYNRGASFIRAEAGELLERAEAAFRAWDAVRDTPPAHMFLVLLLLGERWNR